MAIALRRLASTQNDKARPCGRASFIEACGVADYFIAATLPNWLSNGL